MTDEEPRLTRYGNYKLTKAEAAAAARLWRAIREQKARERGEDREVVDQRRATR